MDTLTKPQIGVHLPTPLLSAAFGLSKSLRALLGIQLAIPGIIVGQDHFLAILQLGRSISVGDAATALGVRASTVSKMADRLVKAGWVEREIDPSDMRRSFLGLTPLGGHVRGQVLEIWAEIDRDLRAHLHDLGETERQVQAIEKRLTTYVSRLR